MVDLVDVLDVVEVVALQQAGLDQEALDLLLAGLGQGDGLLLLVVLVVLDREQAGDQGEEEQFRCVGDELGFHRCY